MVNHALDFKTKSTILHFCLVKFRVNQNDTNGIFNMCWLYFITWVLLDDSFSKRRSQEAYYKLRICLNYNFYEPLSRFRAELGVEVTMTILVSISGILGNMLVLHVKNIDSRLHSVTNMFHNP